MSARKQTLAVVMVVLMALSTVAPAVAAGGPGSAPAERLSTDQHRSTDTVTSSSSDSQNSGHASSDRPATDAGTTLISDGIRNATGTVTAVVRLEEAQTTFSTSAATTRSRLKAQAERTQATVEAFAADRQGVEVLQSFWLTNAVLVELNVDRLGQRGLQQLAGLPGVTEIHENFEISLPEPAEPAGNSGSAAEAPAGAMEMQNGYNVTYGLDQVNATEVWSQYDTMGGGVKVAVLDTGVSVDHPDIQLYTEDASDPTYPGGWAEFDSQGEMVEGSEPHADGYHGTHTSATVSGENASGLWIGVAPNVSLMHGQVIPGGGGTFAQIIGGMEWAAEENADVVSMSLGASGQLPQMIEPVRNLERAGVALVSSSGNDGAYTSGSPANVYEAFAVGASNEDLGIAEFSSGETIYEYDWGDAMPSSWPDEYVVPDVAAPGVQVLSAVPSGTFEDPDAIWGYGSGTSMAAPHVAGAMALLESASGRDLTPAQLRAALRTSAWKPANCSPSCDPRAGKDTRYGAGLVDALAAVSQVAGDTGVTGTVTNDTGAGIQGAEVTKENGFFASTDASGNYTLYGQAGEYDLTASAFGFVSETKTVTVTDGNFSELDFTLADKLELRQMDGQKRDVHAGDDVVSVTVRAAHADNVTVAQLGNVSTENATLTVNGEAATFGEPFALGGGFGEVTVTVETDAQATGTLELEHTFAGAGATKSVTTGVSHVYAEPVPVAVLNTPEASYGTALSSTLEETLPPQYEVTDILPSDLEEQGWCWECEPVSEEQVNKYDTIVVQNLSGSEEFTSAFQTKTSGPGVGVVYLGGFGGSSNSIYQLSRVTDDPNSVKGGYSTDYSSVSYKVKADHPLFEGVAQPGDLVELYSAPTVLGATGFHSYFQGYEGEFRSRTLATVGAGDYSFAFTESGPALAVDQYRNTVLAASLGRTGFVPGDSHTEDSMAILVNAVEFTADAPSINPTSGQDRRVDPGKSTTVNVSGFGDRDVTELTVDLADSSTLDSDDLTLHVNGKVAAFGQTLAYDGTDSVTIQVTADESVTGMFSLESAVTTEGPDGSVQTTTLRTGPTSVYETPLDVPTDVESLEEAMDMVPVGGEVVVADGVYRVNQEDEGILEDPLDAGLYVGKRNVTLRGADGATPRVVFEDPSSWGLQQGAVIYSDKPGVTLANMKVNVLANETVPEATDLMDGIRFQRTQDVTVRNVTVAGVNSIRFDMVEDILVADSHSTGVGFGMGTGISNTGMTDARFVNNTYTQLRYDWGTGLNVYTAEGTTAVNNTFRSGTGVSIYGGSNTTVRANDFLATDHTGQGVVADLTANARIVHNHVNFSGAEGKTTGIDVAGLYFDHQTVSDNHITDTDRGIVLRDGVNATVMMNNVSAKKALLYRSVSNRTEGSEQAHLPEVRFNRLMGSQYSVYVMNDTMGSTADVRMNMLTDDMKDMTGGPGDVMYDPMLSHSPMKMAGEMDMSMAEMHNTTMLTTDLTLEAGTTYALGVPGPEAGTIGEILGEFQGVVYTYETGDGWQLAHGDDRVDPLDAMLVVPTEDTHVTMSFRGSQPVEPNRHSLEKGLNFVAAPSFTRAEDAFSFSNVEVTGIFHQFAEPNSQLGPHGELQGNYEFTGVEGTGPNVSAMTGYFVLAEGDGTLVGNLQANPDVQELYGQLGLHMNGSITPMGTESNAMTGVADMSVEEITEQLDHEDAIAQAVKRAAADDVAEALDRGQREPGVSSVEALRSVGEEFAVDQSSEHADAVERGLQLALREALADRFDAAAFSADSGPTETVERLADALGEDLPDEDSEDGEDGEDDENSQSVRTPGFGSGPSTLAA